jgi:hypothetical protein
VEIGPLRIPILVDVAVNLEPVLTRGVLPGGEPARLPMIPAGSMVAMFPPDLANHVRAMVQQTMAAIQKASANGQPVR